MGGEELYEQYRDVHAKLGLALPLRGWTDLPWTEREVWGRLAREITRRITDAAAS